MQPPSFFAVASFKAKLVPSPSWKFNRLFYGIFFLETAGKTRPVHAE
jgi:hypothetical protein